VYDALKAGWPARLDASLLALPAPARAATLALTIVGMIVQSLPWVPRDVLDLSRLPLLNRIHQQETFGSDTVADSYESRVVLTDVRDMYTKRETTQTALEQHYWSKAASAPYPPAMLLAESALYALAGRTLTNFYLAVIALAVVFLALSLIYYLRTRWYLFPLLYLNFQFLGERFVGVQDCSYLVMLTVVMAALFAARARRNATHLLVALAIAMKLSPLYYVTEVLRMPRRTAVLFVGILVGGLVLPYFVWANYPYIYSYGSGLKGSFSNHLSALVLAPPFAAAVWYVDRRCRFDMEDRVGWSLIPMALFLGVWTNGARHLLLPLLVPDKRVWRNLPVPITLALHAAFPRAIPLGSVLTLMIGLLAAILAGYAAFAPELGGRDPAGVPH
jgi:hypothetical protein